MFSDPTNFVGFEPVQLNNLTQRESRLKSSREQCHQPGFDLRLISYGVTTKAALWRL
jgi:hypothetical protein